MTQRSATGEARTRNSSISSQALYHWAIEPLKAKNVHVLIKLAIIQYIDLQ